VVSILVFGASGKGVGLWRGTGDLWERDNRRYFELSRQREALKAPHGGSLAPTGKGELAIAECASLRLRTTFREQLVRLHCLSHPSPSQFNPLVPVLSYWCLINAAHTSGTGSRRFPLAPHQGERMPSLNEQKK